MATAGPRKKLGPQGPQGETPDHEWSGARLRFQNPDGTWGEYTNLKGPKGAPGVDGKNGLGGANGRNGIGVPAGGSTGEVLTKFSNTDYDTYWVAGGGGGPATQSAKTVVTFNTDVGTAVLDLVRVNGANSVTKIADNTDTEMPGGIFGVVSAKPTATTCEVTFIGVVSGFTGFTTGLPVYVSVLGVASQTIPATGLWQTIGFAVSTTELFVYIKTPLEQ